MEALHEQYRRAVYEVFPTDNLPALVLVVGEVSPGLNDYLEQLSSPSFTFLTAYNPGSVRRPRSWNRRRQSMLEAELSSVVGVRRGVGRSRSTRWREPSLLVPGWSDEEARSWGRRFGQAAVLWGRRGEPVQLLFASPPTEARS